MRRLPRLQNNARQWRRGYQSKVNGTRGTSTGFRMRFARDKGLDYWCMASISADQAVS